MATKKPASKTAQKTSTSRAVVPWEKEMAEAAKRQAKVEKPMGGFAYISTRGGRLSIDDTPIKENKLRIIVLQAIHENQYFTDPFDPNKPQTPQCYAFGDPKEDDPEASMAPHTEAPERQVSTNQTCADCELNKMGSAEQGRGKACKNVRRLAVVTEDALESAKAMKEAEVRMLKVPVMSVKGWVNYVHQLDDEMSRPYYGVITLLELVPDPKSQFRVTFAFEELIQFDQDLYDAMKAKIKEVTGSMLAPYPVLEEEAPKSKGRGGRAQPMVPKGRVAQKAVARKSKY